MSQDTISAVVSKALIDQNISHDVYVTVVRQADQYRQQKLKHQIAKYKDADKAKNDEIRAQVRTGVNELQPEIHDRLYTL